MLEVEAPDDGSMLLEWVDECQMGIPQVCRLLGSAWDSDEGIPGWGLLSLWWCWCGGSVEGCHRDVNSLVGVGGCLLEDGVVSGVGLEQGWGWESCQAQDSVALCGIELHAPFLCLWLKTLQSWHTREFISAQKTSRTQNNKDLSCLRQLSPGLLPCVLILHEPSGPQIQTQKHKLSLILFLNETRISDSVSVQ